MDVCGGATGSSSFSALRMKEVVCVCVCVCVRVRGVYVCVRVCGVCVFMMNGCVPVCGDSWPRESQLQRT